MKVDTKLYARHKMFCTNYTKMCINGRKAFSSAYTNCMAEAAAMPPGDYGTAMGNSFECRE